MMKYVLDFFLKFFFKGLINKYSNFFKKVERLFFKNVVYDFLRRNNIVMYIYSYFFLGRFMYLIYLNVNSI